VISRVIVPPTSANGTVACFGKWQVASRVAFAFAFWLSGKFESTSTFLIPASFLLDTPWVSLIKAQWGRWYGLVFAHLIGIFVVLCSSHIQQQQQNTVYGGTYTQQRINHSQD
jgi:hypothetical protein